MTQTADAIVCGAGILGIACAWHLTANAGLRRVAIVDERPPLSLTSDKSTEGYRNWWPGPGNEMVSFMNRSIDWLEALADASGNRFHLNRRGYLFVTADPNQIALFEAAGREGETLGAGPFRRHEGNRQDYVPHLAEGYGAADGGAETPMDGADLLIGEPLIRRHFPWLSPDVVAVLHARRCGWMSAQQLGMYLLEEARRHGASLVQGHLEQIVTRGGQVTGVRVSTGGGSEQIDAPVFVNAAGPYASGLARQLGANLPMWHEAHVKMSFQDHAHAVARDAPMCIWMDPVRLPWSSEERAALNEEPAGRDLLEPFPSGVHGRPEGGMDADTLILYWTYEDVERRDEPVFPIDPDPRYPEIVLRGMSAMAPRLSHYFGQLPKPYLDGGYYARTQENRPLIGPLPVAGAYICAAFSGFGIMGACAGGELLAAHVTGDTLPPWADALSPTRYDDPDYRARLRNWPADDGQL